MQIPMNPQCCPATLRTFPAPFCYLPPQKRANHASGNNSHLALQAEHPPGKIRKSLKILGSQGHRTINKPPQGKVGLLIAYACMYK
ncbi:hypothetical protein CU664_24825 [Pseudomonas syringae pv. actinidifoliorum]|nr:hypothetical protein [Pseudomonas syringae pv. actinidifoliorum]NAT66268.1 hypothetical protein [Pseudomonas syringae pv. actinidifoliorum]